MLNATPKYVASIELTEPLPWPNSRLLRSPAENAVAELKNQIEGVLAIMGSGRLIEALLPHSVIDEFLLMIHPVVLGSGSRLFPEGITPLGLQLVDALPTDTGGVALTYETLREN